MFRTKEKKKKNRVGVKKGINGKECMERRRGTVVQLRKNVREEQMQKRRAGATGGPAPDKKAEAKATNIVDPAQVTTPALSELNSLKQALHSQSVKDVITAAIKFRKLLSLQDSPPIQQVINAGVVPRMLELIKKGNIQLQFELAWAVTNLASGKSDQTQHVVDHGAIMIFVWLLGSKDNDVREQAVWALGNIAGDSTELRNKVIQCGGIQAFMRCCTPSPGQPMKISIIRNATWAMSNLCRGKPQPAFNLLRPLLVVLKHLIMCNDTEVLTDAAWALSYLSDDTDSDNQRIEAIVQAGILPRLISLLKHPSTKVQTPALRAVGNVVTGTDSQTEACLRENCLGGLLSLLSSSKRTIRKEACWTISNITAGTQKQIEMVIAANILPTLIHILKTNEFIVKKEAVWALCNITNNGGPKHISHLVKQGVITPLVNMLECEDPKILMVALEGVENILKAGYNVVTQTNPHCSLVEAAGGVDRLDDLQSGSSDDVYEKAYSILKTFYEEDDSDVEELLPARTRDTNGQEFFKFGLSTPVKNRLIMDTPAHPQFCV